MSAPPRFSVVIPLYNKEGQIARALDSVLAQTLQDFEIVVVDDGSKDRGAELVAAYDDPRIRLHRQANAGVSAARNQGVALARAATVAFLDGDDAWYPHHLEALRDLSEVYPGAVAWAANYHLVGLDGSRTLGVTPDRVDASRLLLTPDNFFRIARLGTPVFSSAVAVDKAALLRVGGFPVGIRLGEDLDTWIRLLFDGPIAFDSRTGAFYHADGDDRALVRNPPPARYVFFDTNEAWMRAHPEAVEVAADMEEFHNFFRLVHAYHQIRHGQRRAAREMLRSLRTRHFTGDVRRLLMMSRLPLALYDGLAALRRRLRPAAPVSVSAQQGLNVAKGKLGANLVSNVAFFALNIVVSLWLVSYLVRHLGVAAYGMVPLAVTIAGYFNVITAGLNAAVGRHLTVAIGAKDLARASGLYNSALWAAAAVALAMCALGLPLLTHIGHWIDVPAGLEVETGWLFYLTLVGLALTTLGTPFQAVVYSHNRFDLQNLGNILGLVARVVVVVALFSLWAPHIWHVGLSVVAATLLTLATVVWASRWLEPGVRPKPSDFSWPLTRELTGTGGWIFVNQIGTLLLVNIDLLVANKIVGAADAGRYALVLQWSLLLRNFALVIVSVFGPTMMLLYAEGRIDELVSYARRSVRFMGLAMALPVGLVCGLAGPLLHTWLGPDFVPLALIMVLVTGHLGLNLAYLPLTHIPTATNHVKWPGVVQVIAGVVNLAAAILLAKAYGLIGIAIAGGSVLLLRNTLFTPLYAAKVLDRPLWSFVKGAVPMFLVSVGVGLAAWGAAELLRPRGWFALVGTGALVSLLYALVAWFLLLSAQERERIGAGVRAKLGRRGAG